MKLTMAGTRTALRSTLKFHAQICHCITNADISDNEANNGKRITPKISPALGIRSPTTPAVSSAAPVSCLRLFLAFQLRPKRTNSTKCRSKTERHKTTKIDTPYPSPPLGVRPAEPHAGGQQHRPFLHHQLWQGPGPPPPAGPQSAVE
jgi:hypothetical protein